MYACQSVGPSDVCLSESFCLSDACQSVSFFCQMYACQPVCLSDVCLSVCVSVRCMPVSLCVCQMYMSLLFQVKTENPPLLFCLLISSFLSSVSIKPMTTMLVFLWCVCVCVGGWSVCGCVCVCGSGMLICFVSALGSHEMGRHK